ncbi:precorrin-3B synthase [Streptomyces catenulae]|uniref:Precorrin-3B synthase n=1 Tax=Streptomyces catenulae TaxID=66875 RepID=A0ABV2YXG1_9ACTN|nr:precorrin-3B synthase [Streptomyces catenulae]
MLAAMPPSPSNRPHGAQPPLRERGDACPGALRLHAAADGALARVRVPAGELTGRQATALADAAERFGDGGISLTSRGNVELRGLGDGCGGDLAALLDGAGLLPSVRHERVRNLIASPLAGIDRHTPADVRRWARELDGLLCGAEWTTRLSGRFLFVLDDGRGDVASLGGDVTLVAEAAGPGAGAPGAASALLLLGGPGGPGDGSGPALRIAGADAARAALGAARAFLDAVEASGSGAWRFRELPGGAAPTARAVGERLRAAGIPAAYVPSGEVPERPGSGARIPAPGLVEGPGGRRALSVPAPLGRLTGAQWRLLARTAAEGDGTLRLTPWRGVLVPGLSAPVAAARLRECADAGLVTDPDSPWYRLGACTGRPGCAKSLTDVRTDATAVATALGRATALPVQWSGCARRCGHPHGTWLDVLATDGGYDVTVVRPGAPPEPLATGATVRQVADAVAPPVSPSGPGTTP